MPDDFPFEETPLERTHRQLGQLERGFRQFLMIGDAGVNVDGDMKFGYVISQKRRGAGGGAAPGVAPVTYPILIDGFGVAGFCGPTFGGQLSFTNPFPSTVKVHIEGQVDDDVLINGVVYQPGLFPFHDTGGCGFLSGHNGEHYFYYDSTIGAGGTITVGLQNNFAGDCVLGAQITFTP